MEHTQKTTYDDMDGNGDPEDALVVIAKPGFSGLTKAQLLKLAWQSRASKRRWMQAFERTVRVQA